jgi:DNA-binding GntR family transcriptional regulator
MVFPFGAATPDNMHYIDEGEERTMHARQLNKTLPASSKRTLGEEVADRLRQDILSGRLAAGAVLRENTLADEMGVSRGPVREALSLLAREGLVILPRNHSAYVARLSPADLEELHSLRQALAPLAVRLAARNATAAELNELESMVAAMEEHSAHLSGQDTAEAAIRFHDAIYRASKHRLLIECWGLMRPFAHMLLLSQAVAQPGFPKMAIDQHRALLAALRAHDEERAVALAGQHTNDAYEDVKRHYGEPD